MHWPFEGAKEEREKESKANNKKNGVVIMCNGIAH